MAKTDIVDLGARRSNLGRGYTLTERTYLDRNGHATTDRAQGVTLLGPAGRVIPAEAARVAGLGPHAEHETKAEAQDTETTEEAPKPKRRRKRTGDKMRRAEGDK